MNVNLARHLVNSLTDLGTRLARPPDLPTSGNGIYLLYLTLCHTPPPARLAISLHNLRDSHRQQLPRRMPHSNGHSPDLPIQAVAHRNLQPGSRHALTKTDRQDLPSVWIGKPWHHTIGLLNAIVRIVCSRLTRMNYLTRARRIEAPPKDRSGPDSESSTTTRSTA